MYDDIVNKINSEILSGFSDGKEYYKNDNGFNKLVLIIFLLIIIGLVIYLSKIEK